MYIHTMMRLIFHITNVPSPPAPSTSAYGRCALLDINLRGVEVADDCDLDDIAKRTEGYSGADIKLQP